MGRINRTHIDICLAYRVGYSHSGHSWTRLLICYELIQLLSEFWFNNNLNTSALSHPQQIFRFRTAPKRRCWNICARKVNLPSDKCTDVLEKGFQKIMRVYITTPLYNFFLWSPEFQNKSVKITDINPSSWKLSRFGQWKWVKFD